MTLTGHVVGGQIVLDGPIPLPDGTVVRVEPLNLSEEPSTIDALRLVEQSGALDFWKSADEDVYSASDGEPV